MEIKIENARYSSWTPKDCIMGIAHNALAIEDPIATEYSLPVSSFVGPTGNKFYCVPEDSIPKIWGYADKQFEKAAQLYLGVK